MVSLRSIEIDLSAIQEGLSLIIDERRQNTLFEVEDAADNNEARYQLVEGCFYDYEFSDSAFSFLNESSQIVQPHARQRHIGSLAPNIFVGTLSLPICYNGVEAGSIELEVQSVKTGYRDDYRDMLELITEKCTDLLLQANSPVSHNFDTDYTKSPQTLYQRFAFIKAIIGTEEFADSVHRIITAPVTNWKETHETRDIRQARRFSNSNLKEFIKGGNRSELPNEHYLRPYGLHSLPERISSIRKTDSVDTPENRFVKHALEVFLKFCTDINTVSAQGSKLKKESELLIKELESHLHHSVFKEISRPSTLKINSPVLQHKEGYREILRVWLMFDLAAKLVWAGGEDVYSGGKKDIAVLYEYWLFFKLLDLFQSIFQIDPKDLSELITVTEDGLGLQIKQGKLTALRGIYDAGSRKLNIRFNYNRSFSGKNAYPASGSWTTTMRPDYTLSFWPLGINEDKAEKEELIVHIHFDAKYKVANLHDFIDQGSTQGLDEEKELNRKGVYKNADLLKMHAYKDAIRRTGGAYVLYPGNSAINQKGFHEIIPGLGAFPVKPSKTESGVSELKSFILEIIDHFINRATQREKLAFRTYDIYKEAPDSENAVRDPLPEPYGANRALLPDQTFVLVGFYKTEQYAWIQQKKLYNFRMGTGSGSLILDADTVSAQYLLLHTSGDQSSGDLWKITSKGPRVFSKGDLIKRGYKEPSQSHYLVIEIEKATDPEFIGKKWNFKALSNYSAGRASAVPFTATLTEVMKQLIKV